MQILIPMAGEGSRFQKEGYTVSKPAIQTTYLGDLTKYPMVVCATKHLPDVEDGGANIIYIDRDFHKRDGVEDIILKSYPQATFITIDALTEGQASTCMLAKEHVDPKEQLFIAGCDNGMMFDIEAFNALRETNDVLVFTYRNDESVVTNPDQYGWVNVDGENRVTSLSIKKAISDQPKNDHAIVSSFWFKNADVFFNLTQEMIDKNDRINNEFYVDQVIQYAVDHRYNVRVFEIEKYLGWGTPTDYEHYEKTIQYWKEFLEKTK